MSNSITITDVANIANIILAALALVVTIYLFHKEHKVVCRVKVSSICGGFEVRLENVGTGVMHIKEITYSSLDGHETSNFSQFFYDRDCVTRTEARLKGDYLFPNSKHRLFSTTFATQDELLDGWKTISSITVKVKYYGSPLDSFSFQKSKNKKDRYNKHNGKKVIEECKNLKDDYDTFMDALKYGDNAGNRMLNNYK
jgi:hypothetical protein